MPTITDDQAIILDVISRTCPAMTASRVATVIEPDHERATIRDHFFGQILWAAGAGLLESVDSRGSLEITTEGRSALWAYNARFRETGQMEPHEVTGDAPAEAPSAI